MLLVDALAQILREALSIFDLLFELLTYFLPLAYIINGFLAMTKIYICVKFGDDWSSGATCILLVTFIRTEKDAEGLTDKPSDEHTCQNLKF